ncbi:unnamed protein product [Echinostoma caproni]|uniref:BRCT domain-containing protein n=1 Tax=Echinostoma caproni TaxID=27848 RepID=A0A183ART9_9TREM|nr:unnamed protein product [Echinostoma caproni]
MMRYATVLVDGYTVPRQDWFLQETGRSGLSELRIHMPERPTGRCWIELETMHHGRIRCPQEFQYTAASAQTEAPVSSLSTTEANAPSTEGQQRPLSRMGSQRSSLLVRDRRSVRRTRPPTAETALTETNVEAEASRSPSDEITMTKSSTPVTANASITSESKSDAPTPFIRRGSNRSSLSVVDRRSTRRLNPTNKPILPNKDSIGLTESDKVQSHSPVMDKPATNGFSTSSPYDPTEDVDSGSATLTRSGSQRSSLRVSDRRSQRHSREQRAQLLSKLQDGEITKSSEPEPSKPTVTVMHSEPEASLSVPDSFVSKQLTPVFEDPETPNTPKQFSMQYEMDTSDSTKPIPYTADSEITTQIPFMRTKRVLPNTDVHGDVPAEKQAREEEMSLCAGNSPSGEQNEVFPSLNAPKSASNPHQNSIDSPKTEFDQVPQPQVSATFLASGMSHASDNLDSANHTPTNIESESFPWNSPELKSTRNQDMPITENYRDVKPPESFQQSNKTDLTESNPIAAHFPTCSPHGSTLNGYQIDPRSSTKSESLFSLNSLEQGPKPIASKSPSLIRASHSHESEMQSDSTPPHSDDEIPFDMERSQPDDEDDAAEMEELSDEEVDQEVEEEVHEMMERASPGFQTCSGIESMKENASPFIRTGSQRSSMRVLDRRSTRRRPPGLLPNVPAIPKDVLPKQPDSPQLSDESPIERYEASGEAGSESNLSAENSPLDGFQGYSARRRNSHRSEASGQSRILKRCYPMITYLNKHGRKFLTHNYRTDGKRHL